VVRVDHTYAIADTWLIAAYLTAILSAILQAIQLLGCFGRRSVSFDDIMGDQTAGTLRIIGLGRVGLTLRDVVVDQTTDKRIGLATRKLPDAGGQHLLDLGSDVPQRLKSLAPGQT
jgi:hypothetical protein